MDAVKSRLLFEVTEKAVFWIPQKAAVQMKMGRMTFSRMTDLQLRAVLGISCSIPWLSLSIVIMQVDVVWIIRNVLLLWHGRRVSYKGLLVPDHLIQPGAIRSRDDVVLH
ncbi:hypothetical protein GWK47_026124 [Chionoecetes opilio]|uniref:Uncharacterized protein n=1 Tax=Chionoecetes opilio TaxID=41210 RepID=A0A8J8WEP2_CHIOP|nr:hypothetical protein GWK47_026124 [Chionoecetes opilio]